MKVSFKYHYITVPYSVHITGNIKSLNWVFISLIYIDLFKEYLKLELAEIYTMDKFFLLIIPKENYHKFPHIIYC